MTHKCFMVNVLTKNFTGEAGRDKYFREKLRLNEGCLQRRGSGLGRHVCFIAMKHMKIRNILKSSVAAIEAPRQRGGDDARG